MYALQKVTKEWQQIPQLSEFYNDLPKKPYCSDIKNFCKKRSKRIASQLPYLQPNHPDITKYLVIDIDSTLKNTSKQPYYDDTLFFRYLDRHLPTPTFIARNKENGHVQYFIKLTNPVSMFEASHAQPIRFLKNIRYALTVQYGGDLSFGGSLAKNPLDNKTWDIYITGAGSYTLNDLAEYIDFKDPANKPPKKSSNDEHISPFAGLGRNCDTFDYLRFIAYPIAPAMTQKALYEHLLALGKEFNSQFECPMSLNRVKTICRSIAKFCKKSPRYIEYTKKFSAKQAQQGRKGGLKSDSSKGGIARSNAYNDQREQARDMYANGAKITVISQALNIHRNTITRWVKIP